MTFITDQHQQQETLLDIASQIGVLLNASSRMIYLEADYYAHTNLCTTEEILRAWLAIVEKGGKPRQIAPLAGRVE